MMMRMRSSLFLLMLFSLSITATCLAASAASSSLKNPQDNSGGVSVKKIACVISTNQNGGHSNVFTFPASSSLDGSNITSMSNQLSPPKLRLLRHLSLSRPLQSIQSGIRSTFLPSGYPSRTPDGYLSYAAYSWIQDLSTQLRNVLATQRILEGVGVGKQGATALSALLNFLLRDGCGMVATLLFTAAAASRFRSDVKRWRLFADLMVDVGMTLEVAAVSVPSQFFLPMICIGNMCKAICGVAAGACGGAINLHWSKGSDISDINAKFAAQNTVTGSLGLIFAALLARSLSSVPTHQLWLVYGLLTTIHIWANRQCMRLLALDYLNTNRMRMVVSDFFRIGYPYSSLLLPNPKQISQQEPLLFLPKLTSRSNIPDIPIRMGLPFPDFMKCSKWDEADLKTSLSHDSSYLVASGPTKKNGKKLCIVVVVMSDATPLQHTKAYFHALLLKRRLGESTPARDMTQQQRRMIEMQVQMEVDDAWKHFVKDCHRAGWDLKRSELCSQGYEVMVQYRKT